MFPYGMGWPGYQPMPNQQSEVDWGSLARQWMQRKAETDQSLMWDPSIPPPTYIPPPPPMSIPPPPILERPMQRQAGIPPPSVGMPIYPSPTVAPPPPPPPPGKPPPAPPRTKSPTRPAAPLLPDPPAQQPWLVRKQPSSEPEVTNDLKKKRLPAWIREGLEKIEQEKNKKMQEKASQQNQAPVVEEKSQIEVKKVEKVASNDNTPRDFGKNRLRYRESSQSSERPDEEEKSDDNYWAEAETAGCLPKDMPAEERLELKMTVLRRFMTDLLLSVTNTEMRALVEAEKSRMERLKEDKPKRLAESAALSSLAKEDSSPSETSGASSRSPASLRAKSHKMKSINPSENSTRSSKTRKLETIKREEPQNSPKKGGRHRKGSRSSVVDNKHGRSTSSRHRSRSPVTRQSRSSSDGGKKRRKRRRRSSSDSVKSKSRRNRHRNSRHRSDKHRGKAADSSTNSESSS